MCSTRSSHYSICYLSLITIFIIALLFSCSAIGLTPEDDSDDSNDTENGDQTELEADSYESNDELGNAKEISTETAITANIHNNEDVDFYSFTTGHSSDTYDTMQITLSTESSELHFRLELFNLNGESLATVRADNPGQDISYSFICNGGSMIIRVSGWDTIMGWDNGSHGNYTVEIENLDQNDSYAPNHSFETAADENLDTDISGTILSAGYEEDFYKFTNPNPEYWQRFDVNFTNVSEDYLVHFDVYDSDRNILLDTIEGNNEGANVSDSFTTKTDTFYVKVYGHDYYGDTSGDYTLNVSIGNSNDDNEPDDTFETAMYIDLSSLDYNGTGTIVKDAANDNDGDYEFFKVDLAAGKQITIEVDPEASDMEVHFSVYDESEALKHSEDGDNGQTIGYIPYNSGSTDTYFYVKLGGFLGDSANGNYSISFTEEDYTP